MKDVDIKYFNGENQWLNQSFKHKNKNYYSDCCTSIPFFKSFTLLQHQSDSAVVRAEVLLEIINSIY